MMHFLLDEQLPAGLVTRLEGEGFTATHVSVSLGFGASDTQVAREAERLNAVLFTKDADFVERSARYALKCPVVWIRLGNLSTRDLWQSLKTALPRVVEELNQGARVIQVI